jgi:hypothetical protein
MLDNGEIIYKRLQQPDENVLIAEGIHSAIIDHETWEAAQTRFARNPRVTYDRPLKNPLSGIIYCSKCGRSMFLHPYKHTESRFECRTKPRCYKSIKQSEVIKEVLFALEYSELPNLQLKVKNGDGDSAKIQQRLLEKLEKQMQEYREQEENQYELLETKKYTQELFDRRNAALREKMELCQKQIYDAKQKIPKSLNYAEQVATLQSAITALKDPDMKPAHQNRILKSIVERIDFTGEKSLGADQSGCVRNTNIFSIKVKLIR